RHTRFSRDWSSDVCSSDLRVWIFQANRALTNNEVQIANERLRAFTDEWQVHGAPLDSSYSVRHNQFIVLAADESQQSASGCSIRSEERRVGKERRSGRAQE